MFYDSTLGNRARVSDRTSRLLVGRSFLLAAAMAAVPAVSHADDSLQLEEIVVTAQKRTENLQDVPIAIDAVSGTQLAAAGVSSTNDLPSVVAGLSVNTTVQSFSPHIRGVGTTSFGPGVENPVGLYVDNVYYGSQLMGLGDMNDVAQIAVLKGPQGTLFGRNATGGVIQLSTRDPSHTFSGEVGEEFDNYRRSRTTAYVTGGISDELAANLSLRYTTQGKGWGKNLVTGDEIRKIDHDFFAHTKWLWEPTDSTSIKFNADFTNQENNLGPNLRAPVGFSNPNFPGIGNGYSSTNPYDVANDTTNDPEFAAYSDNDKILNKFTGRGASVTVTQDLSFAKLVSISAYRKYSMFMGFDADATSLQASRFFINQSGQQASEEVQLVSGTDQALTWATGLFYFWQRESAEPLDGINTAAFFAPVGATNFVLLRTQSDLSTRALAGFGQATYALTDAQHITAGLRYTKEKRSKKGSIDVYPDGDTSSPVPGFSYSSVGDPSNELDTSKLTWRLAYDYKFTDDLMAYVSWNRGFKSGGFNGFNPSGPAYQPETLDAFEIGSKAEFLDRSLRVNSSVFFYKYDNIQLTDLTAVLPSIVNAAKAELYGLDLDADWRLTQELSLSAGFEYLHTKFTKYELGALTAAEGTATTFPQGDLTGREVPYAPKVTANIGANYALAVGSNTVNFNVNNAYTSKYYTEPDNRLFVKAFNLLNASTTWVSADESWSVGLWGRNLLNKVVPSQLASSAWGDQADYTNPPRTYGVTANYKFGGK